MATGSVPKAVQAEISAQAARDNLKAARKYALTTAKYADKAGKSAAHHKILMALGALDDAREAL